MLCCLQSNWNPLTRLLDIVWGVMQLLVLSTETRGDDPLEPEIYKELQEDPKRFERNARRETQEFAMGKKLSNTGSPADKVLSKQDRPEPAKREDSPISQSGDDDDDDDYHPPVIKRPRVGDE